MYIFVLCSYTYLFSFIYTYIHIYILCTYIYIYIYIMYIHTYIYIMYIYIYILCTCIYIYIFMVTQHQYSKIDIMLNKKYQISNTAPRYPFFLSMADPRQSSSACAGRAYSPSGEPLGGSKPPGRSMKSGDFTNKKGWNMGIYCGDIPWGYYGDIMGISWG